MFVQCPIILSRRDATGMLQLVWVVLCCLGPLLGLMGSLVCRKLRAQKMIQGALGAPFTIAKDPEAPEFVHMGVFEFWNFVDLRT